MILNYYPSYKEYYSAYTQYSGIEPNPQYEGKGLTRSLTDLYSDKGLIEDIYWVFCGDTNVSYNRITLTNNDMNFENSYYATYTIQADYSPQSINDVEIFVHSIDDFYYPNIGEYKPIPPRKYLDGKAWYWDPVTSISNININPLSFTVTIDGNGMDTGYGYTIHIGVCIFENDELVLFGSARARIGIY